MIDMLLLIMGFGSIKISNVFRNDKILNCSSYTLHPKMNGFNCCYKNMLRYHDS